MVRLAMVAVLVLAACAPAQEEAAISDPALQQVLRDVPQHFLVDPLLHAAVAGNAEEVRRLLAEGGVKDSGARIDAVLEVVAATTGCDPSVIDVLVEAGGDPLARSETGGSLLHAAAAAGAVECYFRILALGGDVAGIDANGYGVVSQAYLSGNASLFDAVLDGPKAKNPTDLSTALQLALRKHDLLGCRRLLDAGAATGPVAAGARDSSDAAACGEVRYIFAKRAGERDLVFVADGKEFNEHSLRLYLRDNEDRWPKQTVELRVVFDSDVPIAWFAHSRRTFSFLGFLNVRYFGGSVASGRATEIREVGPSIVLPEKRW